MTYEEKRATYLKAMARAHELAAEAEEIAPWSCTEERERQVAHHRQLAASYSRLASGAQGEAG